MICPVCSQAAAYNIPCPKCGAVTAVPSVKQQPWQPRTDFTGGLLPLSEEGRAHRDEQRRKLFPDTEEKPNE